MTHRIRYTFRENRGYHVFTICCGKRELATVWYSNPEYHHDISNFRARKDAEALVTKIVRLLNETGEVVSW